jgi:hypothetical protein
MKRWGAMAAALLLLAVAAQAKNKKPDVAAILGTATYVYVESPDGDIFKPGLYPADRQAISDVEGALHDWGRYKLTTERKQAEIVVVVRKGRLASARVGVQAPLGQPLPPGQSPNGAPGHGPGIGAGGAGGAGIDGGAEAGPEEDMLRVYLLNPDGKLVGPVWNRMQADGLDAPQLLLVRQLRDAVEKAYPQTAAGQPAQPTQPAKP